VLGCAPVLWSTCIEFVAIGEDSEREIDSMLARDVPKAVRFVQLCVVKVWLTRRQRLEGGYG
jgi:hypothetical protein